MRRSLRALIVTAALWHSGAQAAAPEWRYTQEVRSAEAGLVRVKLPLTTLSECRPDLADLRLLDPRGQEVAYFVDRPARAAERWWPLAPVDTTLPSGQTVISGRVPAPGPSGELDALRLETPAKDFLKAVTVEGSRDGTHWTTLARERPIFRQAGGAQSLEVLLARGHWPNLRIMLDDRKSPPIPVTGAAVRSAELALPDLERIEPLRLESFPDANQTHIRLQLPAANLPIASVAIQVDDPVFTRPVALRARTLENGVVTEPLLAERTLYRIALDGHKTAEQLSIPVMAPIPGREAVLRVSDGDNRPLAITKVVMDVIPTYLIFYGQAQADYTLLIGNPYAPAKRYDVSALKDELSSARFYPGTVGPLRANPDFRAPEALPGVRADGSPIDISGWSYRKKVLIRQTGIQRLELDLETLSHEENRGADLRLVRDGKQVPFVLDNTGVIRSFGPQVAALGSPQPGKSRWAITLPYPLIPVTSVRCASDAVLFQRPAALFEMVPDERGDEVRRPLGTALWKRVPDQAPGPLTISLSESPRTNRLILEMDDGDNPPLHLADFHCDYRSPRLLFKADPGAELYLYYGQRDAPMPQYDLALIGHELLAAYTVDASLAAEEGLKAKTWLDASAPAGARKYIFWGAMGVVVIALLGIIAKLLPAEKG